MKEIERLIINKKEMPESCWYIELRQKKIPHSKKLKTIIEIEGGQIVNDEFKIDLLALLKKHYDK